MLGMRLHGRQGHGAHQDCEDLALDSRPGESPLAGPAGLRRAAALNRVENVEIASGAKVESVETRIFRLPLASRVAEALLAAGVAVGLTALALGGGTSESREQHDSARSLARLLRRDESLRSEGLLGHLPESNPGPNPWAVISSVALAGVALGGAGRVVSRAVARKAEADGREKRAEMFADALSSPFRGVRLKALQSLLDDEDPGCAPVELVMGLANDKDPVLSSLAKRVLISHPAAPLDVLRQIATTDRFHGVRMAAMDAVEIRRAQGALESA